MSTTDIECPYCGGKAHRKAVQRLRGEDKPYRRHYCVDGCGHYHYRDLDTNEHVDVGPGPKECRLHVNRPVEFLDVTPFEQKMAVELGIDPDTLVFTSMMESGRPRVIANCLSELDIAALPVTDWETVRRLHKALLTAQACLNAYRERAKRGTVR